jgi:hypothetical protein
MRRYMRFGSACMVVAVAGRAGGDVAFWILAAALLVAVWSQLPR